MAADRHDDASLRRAILERRARFVAAALTASGVAACGAQADAESTPPASGTGGAEQAQSGDSGGADSGAQKPEDAGALSEAGAELSGDLDAAPTACLVVR